MLNVVIVMAVLSCFGRSFAGFRHAVGIIGAGPAGIHAAATLERDYPDYFNSSSYRLFHANNAFDAGYLSEIDFAGFIFTPGFLWGYSTSIDKLSASGTPYQQLDYDSYTVYNDNGEDITSEAKEKESAWWEAVQLGYGPILEDLLECKRPDLSAKAAYARGGWIASTDVEKVIEWWQDDIFTGVSASDASVINNYNSANNYEGEYLVLGGNTTLTDVLIGEEMELVRNQVELGKVISILNHK